MLSKVVEKSGCEIIFGIIYLITRHDGDLFCCTFPHEISWMRFWTKLSQYLRVFLPTLNNCLEAGLVFQFK